MNVNSGNIEFGDELVSVVPYTYYLHKQGKLTSTVSATGTEPLYYFSPHHIINIDKRNCNNANKAIPTRHVWEFTGKGEWAPPPYKEHYKNDQYVYDKPILVVSNKYNREWFRDPVNYMDADTLCKIFDRCGGYEVFYNRNIPDNLLDDQGIMDLHEYEVIKERHPEVRFLHELPGDYNLNQMLVYANCDRFISVQGGNSILASYFGGMNIIYAVKGRELECGFYDKLNKLSGCEIVHVMKYSELLKQL